MLGSVKHKGKKTKKTQYGTYRNPVCRIRFLQTLGGGFFTIRSTLFCVLYTDKIYWLTGGWNTWSTSLRQCNGIPECIAGSCCSCTEITWHISGYGCFDKNYCFSGQINIFTLFSRNSKSLSIPAGQIKEIVHFFIPPPFQISDKLHKCDTAHSERDDFVDFFPQNKVK